MKRSPLRSIGKKRRSKRYQRAVVVERVHQRDQVCQWARAFSLNIVPGSQLYFVINDPGCGARGTEQGELDVHEIIPRSAWPDGELVEGNCILLCRRHHQWVDNYPQLAHAMGLHGFSWNRPGAEQA